MHGGCDSSHGDRHWPVFWFVRWESQQSRPQMCCKVIDCYCWFCWCVCRCGARRKVVDLEAYLPVTSCQNQTLEHLLNGSKGKDDVCERKLRKWSLFTLLPIHWWHFWVTTSRRWQRKEPSEEQSEEQRSHKCQMWTSLDLLSLLQIKWCLQWMLASE